MKQFSHKPYANTVLPKFILDFVVVLPPPLNGMTYISQQFANKLSQNARVWPVSNLMNHKGWQWTLVKHAKMVISIIKSSMAGQGKGTCYFILDSQHGIWFNLFEAFLLRLGFSKIILHHHTFSYFSRHDWRVKLFYKILGGKVHHITLSKSMTVKLGSEMDSGLYSEIGNAAFLPQKIAITPKEKMSRLGFLGNITREKGILTAMSVISLLERKGTAVYFDIAGPIKDASLRKLVDEFVANNPTRYRYLGSIHGKDKELFFKEIDLLLFPSHYHNEALPVTIYEALAAAIPVLATPRGCISDQLSGTGWVFDETDWANQAVKKIEEWANNSYKFSENSRLAISVISKAQKKDMDSFDNFCKKFGMLVDKLD